MLLLNRNIPEEKIQKFVSTLRNVGSGSVIKDATINMRWQIAHADDLTEYRAEMIAHCSAVSMLLLTSSL